MSNSKSKKQMEVAQKLAQSAELNLLRRLYYQWLSFSHPDYRPRSIESVEPIFLQYFNPDGLEFHNFVPTPDDSKVFSATDRWGRVLQNLPHLLPFGLMHSILKSINQFDIPPQWSMKFELQIRMLHRLTGTSEVFVDDTEKHDSPGLNAVVLPVLVLLNTQFPDLPTTVREVLREAIPRVPDEATLRKLLFKHGFTLIIGIVATQGRNRFDYTELLTPLRAPEISTPEPQPTQSEDSQA